MGLLDNESIPRRKMILFFMIDTSGSMLGSKIGSVNDAIENVLPMIGEISDENPDAEINVAVLEFSSDTRWLYDEPKDAKEFIWQKVEADGLTYLGKACEELNKKLSRTDGFMPTSTGSGYFAPAIILTYGNSYLDGILEPQVTLKSFQACFKVISWSTIRKKDNGRSKITATCRCWHETTCTRKFLVQFLTCLAQ